MDKVLFRALYPTMPNHVIAEQFGMTEQAVKLYASRHGIHKDAAYLRVIQAERMQGRTRSEETRQKLREKALQRPPLREQTRDRLRQRPVHNRGAAHYKWKGGKPWERFKTPEYQAWRNAVLERDAYICQHCDRHCNKNEKGLAAHHVQPYADHPELRFDVSNGLTLCRSCHMALHSRPVTVGVIPCACGCGILISAKDIYGRPRQYVNHHGRRKRLS